MFSNDAGGGIPSFPYSILELYLTFTQKLPEATRSYPKNEFIENENEQRKHRQTTRAI